MEPKPLPTRVMKTFILHPRESVSSMIGGNEKGKTWFLWFLALLIDRLPHREQQSLSRQNSGFLALFSPGQPGRKSWTRILVTDRLIRIPAKMIPIKNLSTFSTTLPVLLVQKQNGHQLKCMEESD